MGRPKKISSRLLAANMPLLEKLSKSKTSSSMKKILSKQSNESKDLICDCIKLSLSHIPEKTIKKSDLKHVLKEQERLRFLRDYASCSKGKKKCLIHKRNAELRQSGKGLGVILAQVLPFVANIIYDTFIKKKK
jgi:hypothetical protein